MNHISELCKKGDFEALCTYLVQSVTVQGDDVDDGVTVGGAKAAQDPMIVKKAGERLDDEGRTALHWAVAVGAGSIAQQLASAPYYLNPMTVDVDKVTPLMSACSAGVSYDAIYALLKSAEYNLNNGAPLPDGAVPPKVQQVQQQPQGESGEGDEQPKPAGAEPSQQQQQQVVPAAELTAKDKVKLYVNMQDKLGNSALIAAGSRGNSRLVTLLTSAEFGADVFVQNKRGQTALHRATARGSVDAVEGLIQAAKGVLTQSGMARHRALLNLKDREGNTALHYASMENNQELGELLIRAGANRDAKNNDGREFWQL